MKAIQCKTLAATETLPTRLKVWAEQNKAVVIGRSNEHVHIQAASMICNYACGLGWLDSGLEISVGQLPNGDYCGVLH